MIYKGLTERIIACAIEVHRELGPGLLESIYESALAVELFQQGIRFARQKPLPVTYKGQSVGDFRIDLLVEDLIVVELKSVERNDPLFEAQLLSYMKLGGYNVGLLVDFNSMLLAKGIKRLVL
ncbi:GxxExxY protein [Geomonas subterranea]|uniref:GxxExxY protein n=1 Tax=Geomonas subterranea TaxID=2847989 RepID=A0ABX8LI55_9BACT|nr:GxxExxY protein [Geomonas subterranea]QXE90586.1 GxxExxY protein [Geomonas subterranea]QXM11334.1 GxxExxY protein [Geomonas subterranea]